MRKFLILFMLLSMLYSCQSSSSNEIDEKKNEVIVLGAIHGRHLTSKRYGVDTLKAIIKTIAPNIVLTEIPPDRFDAAVEEFKKIDTITEARVTRFPEYVNVLFPLSKEMDFTIIPTAGWTKPMADARSKKLREISQDSSRRADWQAYQAASAKSDSVQAASGANDDPYWIHTDAYDEAIEIWASTYNRLFNEELGAGGWDNINQAHYGHIENALNKYTNQGKRVLIIYGAGHKGWFIRQLRKRTDIDILSMKPFLDQVYQ